VLPRRIDHFFFVEEATARQAAEEGVCAVVQPAQLPPTRDHVRTTGLPRGLAYHGYRQMIDAGVRLAGSSDAPVVGFDVLAAIDCAVRRRLRSGASLAAEQSVGAGEVLRMYTRHAAAVLGLEGEIGQLRAGARADAVLLDRDPAAAPPDDLPAVRVLGTFAGRWEYGAQHR
jgi:predicted amidohydrolase YtcJ